MTCNHADRKDSGESNIEWTRPVSDEAVSKNRRFIEAAFQSQRQAEFERMCPVEYRKPDITRLRALAPQQYDQCRGWTYGKSGLLLCGPSGRGKTMTAWQIVRREYLVNWWIDEQSYPTLQCRSIKAYEAPLWFAETKKFMTPDTTGFYEWLSIIRSCDLVFVDDPFKMNISSNATFAFWSMLETRTSRGKPTIITMNGDEKMLLDRMEETDAHDKILPIARRLKEHFTIVRY